MSNILVDPERARLLAEYVVGEADVAGLLEAKGWGKLPEFHSSGDRLDAVLPLLPENLTHSLACDFAEHVLFILPQNDQRPSDLIQAKRAWLERATADADLDTSEEAMGELLSHIRSEYYLDTDFAEAKLSAAFAAISAAAREVDKVVKAAYHARVAVFQWKLRSESARCREARWQIGRLLNYLGIDHQILNGKDTRGREAERQAAQALRESGVSIRFGENGRVETVMMIGDQVQGAGHLEGLTRLRRLVVSGSSMCDPYVHHIERLTSLEYLALSGVSDAALASLDTLVNLRSLGLRHTRVTDAGLVNLKNLARLEYLDLSCTGITDAGLDYLGELTTLTDLNLSDCGITTSGVQRLSQVLAHCIINVSGGGWVNGRLFAN